MSNEQIPLAAMSLLDLNDLSDALDILDKEWESLTPEDLQEMNLNESDRLENRRKIILKRMEVVVEISHKQSTPAKTVKIFHL